MKWSFITMGFVVAVSQLAVQTQAAIMVEFRYGDDTTFSGFNDDSGFFADQVRRDLLNTAADLVTSKLTDHLFEIPATASPSWQAIMNNPSDGEQITTLNMGKVAENTVIIFVAGRDNFDLTDSTKLAEASAGTVFAFSTNSADNELVEARGQVGALDAIPTDYGPWGGSIGFNTSKPWSFEPLESSPKSDEFDFLSVAMHEIAHVLGIGTAPSWDEWVSSGQFTGQASVAEFGAPVPLHSDLEHFANSGISPEPIMDPDFEMELAKFFTDLDYAALEDVGWNLVPEPATACLLLTGLVLVLRRRRVVHFGSSEGDRH